MSRHKEAVRRLAEILSDVSLDAGERLNRAEEILREEFPLPPRLSREQLVAAGRQGGAAGKGESKVRGDGAYYRGLRFRRNEKEKA